LNESETQQVNIWCLLGFVPQPNLLFTQLAEQTTKKFATISAATFTPNFNTLSASRQRKNAMSKLTEVKRKLTGLKLKKIENEKTRNL